jgi:chemotaxis protein MotA
MDVAAPVGIILAFVVVIVSNILEGGDPMALVLVGPMLLVWGTTILVTIAGNTIPDVKMAMRSVGYAMTAKIRPAGDLVPAIVTLAERARREGLLALEDSMGELKDPFLSKGVTMAIDGTDPEELREILEAELHAKKAEDAHAAKFFFDAGGYAPTIGIIGTCMGLVHVLSNLSTPDKLGALIASAFVATLWGIMSANLVWFPLSNRLKRLAALEAARMELTIEGVAAIQSGANPRLVAEKLRSLLPADQQAASAEAA